MAEKYFMIRYSVKYSIMSMVDCLTRTKVINLKEFTMDSINYLVWELRIEFEITLANGSELNFDKSSLHFNAKKKIYLKFTLNLTVNREH